MKSKNDTWDIYNKFLVSEDISRLRKILIRYDLFRKTLNVPGDIVECGVFKGVGLFQWLKLLEIYSSNSNKRVIGFDMFTNFPKNIEDYEKVLKIILRMQILKGLVLNHLKILHINSLRKIN